MRVDGKGSKFGALRPVAQVTRRGMRVSARRRISWSRTRCRQMKLDHRLHLDDARGDLDEPQPQSVELRDPPDRTLRHRDAQAPHEPICAGMQKQPELVGGRLGAGGAVSRQMRLPGFDMVFGLSAPAVDVLIERARIAALRLVTMKRVSGPSAPASTRATMRSTRLQLAAPSRNSLKRRTLPSLGAASKRAFALSSRSYMPAQC